MKPNLKLKKTNETGKIQMHFEESESDLTTDIDKKLNL
jgi:hypothetical protein